MGCGIGDKTALISNYFTDANVTGFDFSQSAIDNANKLYSKTNLSFENRDITLNNPNKEKFDLITAMVVLEHVDDWESILNRIININERYILLSYQLDLCIEMRH